MSSKYGVLVFFCYLWQASFAGENQYACFSVKPTMTLQIADASLSYGKWIGGLHSYDEVGGPSGEVIQARHERTICSSGRHWSPTGTEGFVEFKDQKNNRLKIEWSNPWDNYATRIYPTMDYDPSVFEVEEYTTGYWNARYVIRYRQ